MTVQFRALPFRRDISVSPGISCSNSRGRVVQLDRERKLRLLQAVHRALAEARMALAQARQVAR